MTDYFPLLQLRRELHVQKYFNENTVLLIVIATSDEKQHISRQVLNNDLPILQNYVICSMRK